MAAGAANIVLALSTLPRSRALFAGVCWTALVQCCNKRGEWDLLSAMVRGLSMIGCLLRTALHMHVSCNVSHNCLVTRTLSRQLSANMGMSSSESPFLLAWMACNWADAEPWHVLGDACAGMAAAGHSQVRRLGATLGAILALPRTALAARWACFSMSVEPTLSFVLEAAARSSWRTTSSSAAQQARLNATTLHPCPPAAACRCTAQRCRLWASVRWSAAEPTPKWPCHTWPQCLLVPGGRMSTLRQLSVPSPTSARLQMQSLRWGCWLPL